MAWMRPAWAQLNPRSPQRSGLVAWCPLTPTMVAAEVSRGVSSGTLVNGPRSAMLIDGGLGGWYFDRASSQYVSLGNPTSLQLSGAVTVSAWVLLVSTSFNGVVIAKDAVGQRAYTLDHDNWSGFRFYINGGNVASEGAPHAVGQFTHVCGTYVPSAAIAVYVNGVQVGLNTTSIPASINASTSNVLIGRREYAGFEDNIDGVIVDARVYNRALTGAEVRQLYDPRTRWDLYARPSVVVANTVAAATGNPWWLWRQQMSA